MDTLHAILGDLVLHLRHRREIGRPAPPLTDEGLTRLLAMTGQPQPPPAATERVAETPVAVRDPVAADEGRRAARPPAPRGRPSVTPMPARPPVDVPQGSTPGALLRAIAEEVAACTLCELCRTRNRTVPGQGNLRPQVMIVGEAPGAEEDAQGMAFVGRAGELLTRMLSRLGLRRDEVFIANVLKCRPPENAPPTPEQMAACLPYLRRQIEILQPRVIVTMGNTSVRGLLGPQPVGIMKLRGTWLRYEDRIDVMPTFHPSFLLRPGSEHHRWDTWDDMVQVLDRIGRALPPGTRRERPQPGQSGK